MQADCSDAFEYRGVSISIKVDRAVDRVFGHADLFADKQFKARLSLGSGRSAPSEMRNRLRCLAKAKVDAWAAVSAAVIQ